MILVTVNGDRKEIAADQSLQELVSLVTPSSNGVAVAVNAMVIPKSTWPTTTLSSGDQIEILTAAPGG